MMTDTSTMDLRLLRKKSRPSTRKLKMTSGMFSRIESTPMGREGKRWFMLTARPLTPQVAISASTMKVLIAAA